MVFLHLLLSPPVHFPHINQVNLLKHDYASPCFPLHFIWNLKVFMLWSHLLLPLPRLPALQSHCDLEPVDWLPRPHGEPPRTAQQEAKNYTSQVPLAATSMWFNPAKHKQLWEIWLWASVKKGTGRGWGIRLLLQTAADAAQSCGHWLPDLVVSCSSSFPSHRREKTTTNKRFCLDSKVGSCPSNSFRDFVNH